MPLKGKAIAAAATKSLPQLPRLHQGKANFETTVIFPTYQNGVSQELG